MRPLAPKIIKAAGVFSYTAQDAFEGYDVPMVFCVKTGAQKGQISTFGSAVARDLNLDGFGRIWMENGFTYKSCWV